MWEFILQFYFCKHLKFPRVIFKDFIVKIIQSPSINFMDSHPGGCPPRMAQPKGASESQGTRRQQSAKARGWESGDLDNAAWLGFWVPWASIYTAVKWDRTEIPASLTTKSWIPGQCGSWMLSNTESKALHGCTGLSLPKVTQVSVFRGTGRGVTSQRAGRPTAFLGQCQSSARTPKEMMPRHHPLPRESTLRGP